MKEGFFEFAKNVVTTTDLFKLISDVESAQSASWENGRLDLSKKLKGKVSEDFNRALKVVHGKKLIPLSQEGKGEYFRNLKDYLVTLPRVKIELAFDPSGEFIKKIARVINSEAGNRLILDVSVNPKILAGLTIEYSGNYKDLSYADKLSEVLKYKFKGGSDGF